MKNCYCINPYCREPNHPSNNNTQTKLCGSCGSILLLNNKYRVSRLLSDNSGFGIIYEAFAGFNSKILKVLQEKWNNDTKAVELFRREYDVLLSLTQQNITGIPQAEDYFQYQNREGKIFYCLVMEKVEGIDLEKWVKQDNKLHQKQALNWLREVTLILDKIHQQNWFHRDIKPANIMKRNNGKLVLIDFGTAREETQTYYQKVKGESITGINSPGYTPNEQQHGQAVVQSDFFALGRTFVHLLTGKHPSDLYDALNDEFKWRGEIKDIDPLFLDLIDHLMQRLPKHRPKNTRVILEKLDEIEKKINPPPKPIKKQPQVIAKIPQPTVKQKPSQVISNKSQGVIKKKTPKKKEHIFVRVIKTGLISTSIFGVLAFILVEGYVLFKYKYNILKNFTYPINLLYDFKLLSSDIRSSRFLDKTIRGHSKSVNSVAYSPDGKYLASGSWDNTVKIWEVKTGKLIRTFEGDFSSVAYSPDGRYLATYREPDFDTIENPIKIWEVKTGKLLRTLKGHSKGVHSIAYSPDGKYLAISNWENPVKIREVKTGKLIRTFEGYSILVAYSLDGKYLATESENTIKIWEVKTGKLVRTLTGHSDSVVSVAYSPDGKYLASGSWDNTVKIWEVKTGKSIRTLTGFSGWLSSLTSISYSPDGKYLAARCNIARVSHDSMLDDTVKKWDVGHPICTWEVATGKVIQTLTGHASNINSVAYSPDGKYLASSSSDRQIKIWRVEQNK